MAAIGLISAGKVDELGTEYVATKILLFVVPTISVGSYYAVSSNGGRYQGFEIPLHFKSLFFAYARWGLGIIGILAGVVAAIQISDHDPDELTGNIVCAALSVGAIIGWVLVTFFLGKSRAAVNRQRLILKSVVGFGAEPRILPTQMRTNVAQQLSEIISNHQLPIDSASLMNANVDAGLLPLVFTFSLYQSTLQRESDWHLVAANAWIKLENAGVDTFSPRAEPIIAAKTV